jgi:hypothetical protein
LLGISEYRLVEVQALNLFLLETTWTWLKILLIAYMEGSIIMVSKYFGFYLVHV